MKAPSDGWDEDEHEVLGLDGLNRDLEAIRLRHALGPEDEARLLAQIQQEARASEIRAVRAARSWRWGLSLAAAAVLLAVGAITVLRQGAGSAPNGASQPGSAVAITMPSPVFHLRLEAPAIKVSPSALAWRGPRAENPLLADLKPAFDAFRASDYQGADREFSLLAGKYPAAIEVAFYQGVARLFVGNVPGAIASLTAAERLADSAFRWDVAWYRAVADERAGDLAAARARLGGLCGEPDSRAKAACDALAQLPGGAPTP